MAERESKPSKENYHYVDIHSANPGNPIFTCDKRFTEKALLAVKDSMTKEPSSKSQHPMYSTTTSSYGSLQPTVESFPSSFHGRAQHFSKHLAKSGMYRNNSFNTTLDHSRV